MAWSGSTTWADNIDEALLDKGPQIREYLLGKKYNTVGVFRFQLQNGTGRPTFVSAPLSGNMAARLENALLRAIDTKKPIRIIRNAGE
jgi:hypothetical protein